VGISLLHAIFNIFNLGYAGQDYSQHMDLLGAAQSGILLFNSTNPPGLYVFAAYVSRLTSSYFTMEAIAGALVLVNLVALAFCYVIVRRLIVSIPLRIAAFAIITFLPVRTVTSIVFASDALTVLPMVIMVILVASHVRSSSLWAQLALAMLGGWVWCLALYTKFTFLALPLGITAVCGLWIVRRQAWRSRIRFLMTLVVGAVLPFYFGWWIYSSMKEAGSVHFGKLDKGIGMSWGALLGIQRRDINILTAPEFICDRDMNAAVGYSYISLVHLGAFSDVWNFLQQPAPEVFLRPRPLTKCFPRERPPIAKMLTPVALALSLPITVLGLFGAIYQLSAGLVRNFRSPSAEGDLKLALVFMSIAIIMPPILRLPYYQTVYVFGYWTPRLILPGLLGFLILGFVSLDEFLRGRSPWLSKAVMAYAAMLSGIYLLIL
jgi:hypothetical protein